MDRGWLGFEHAGNGFWYNVTPNLTGAMGVVSAVLGAAGLVWAFRRHTRLDLMVAPYAVVYFVYIGTWKELADRYLLVIVPLLLLLAVRMVVELALLWPRARRFALPAAAVLLAAALVPALASSLAFDRGLSGADTREIAREWIQRNIPAGALIAVENYGPPLVREDQLPHYRQSGLDPVAYRLVRLKLPVPGTPERTHDLARLREQGVQYVVTSSRVRDRVLAAAADYPELAGFYRRLDEEAELVEVFRPGPGERGPTLRLYRTDSSARLTAAAGGGPLGYLRPPSSPGASTAASSTSPSAIGLRPGRTIGVGDEPRRDRQPEVDDAVDEYHGHRHGGRHAEAHVERDHDALDGAQAPRRGRQRADGVGDHVADEQVTKGDPLPERGERAPQGEHVEEPEHAGQHQGVADRPAVAGHAPHADQQVVDPAVDVVLLDHRAPRHAVHECVPVWRARRRSRVGWL